MYQPKKSKMKQVALLVLALMAVYAVAYAYDSAYTGAQVDAEIARSIGRNTAVANPGSDAELVTEQAVREALDLKEDADATIAKTGAAETISAQWDFSVNAPTVPTEVYNATNWDADDGVPTKDAVRDKIESMGAGAGDVVGPSSATDNALTRYDTTTGKLVQNSGVTVDDAGLMTFPAGGGISVPGNSTAAQYTDYYEDTDDGTNYHRLQGQALAANRTSLLPDYVAGFLASTQVDTSGELADRAVDAVHLNSYSESTVLAEPDQLQPISDAWLVKYFPAEMFPSGVTIDALHITTSATCTDALNFEEWTQSGTASSATVEAITLSGTFTEDDGTLTDGSIAADGRLMVDLPATPTNIAFYEITVVYHAN